MIKWVKKFQIPTQGNYHLIKGKDHGPNTLSAVSSVLSPIQTQIFMVLRPD